MEQDGNNLSQVQGSQVWSLSYGFECRVPVSVVVWLYILYLKYQTSLCASCLYWLVCLHLSHLSQSVLFLIDPYWSFIFRIIFRYRHLAWSARVCLELAGGTWNVRTMFLPGTRCSELLDLHDFPGGWYQHVGKCWQAAPTVHLETYCIIYI